MVKLASKKLIEAVLRGDDPRIVVEYFVDDPQGPTLPISNFMQDLVDASEQLKQLRADIDQLSADMTNFEQSLKVPGFDKAKGALNWVNVTSDAMAVRLNEVLAWARQNIQKLGN